MGKLRNSSMPIKRIGIQDILGMLYVPNSPSSSCVDLEDSDSDSGPEPDEVGE